jgi:hypothetical protein
MRDPKPNFKIRLAPLADPGMASLGDHQLAPLSDHEMALLGDHGMAPYGRSVTEAVFQRSHL